MAQELFMNAGTDSNELEDDVSTLMVTCFSDVWSFAMLVLELLTDEIPFPDKILDAAVICALIQGERPKHPRSPKVIAHGLNHELWQHLCRCWEPLPERRLPLQSLYNVLEKLATQWGLTSLRDEGQVRPRVTVSHQPQGHS
jgi:serine/threonine protein kinase